MHAYFIATVWQSTLPLPKSEYLMTLAGRVDNCGPM
jgi:hypothetical protein